MAWFISRTERRGLRLPWSRQGKGADLSPSASPGFSYLNHLVWKEAKWRTLVFFDLEKSDDAVQLLQKRAGLSRATAEGIIAGDQPTLTQEEASALATLLCFPEELLCAFLARRSAPILCAAMNALYAREHIKRHITDEDLCILEGKGRIYSQWMEKMTRPRFVPVMTRLDATWAYDDILAIACELLCWAMTDGYDGRPVNMDPAERARLDKAAAIMIKHREEEAATMKEGVIRAEEAGENLTEEEVVARIQSVCSTDGSVDAAICVSYWLALRYTSEKRDLSTLRELQERAGQHVNTDAHVCPDYFEELSRALDAVSPRDQREVLDDLQQGIEEEYDVNIAAELAAYDSLRERHLSLLQRRALDAISLAPDGELPVRTLAARLGLGDLDHLITDLRRSSEPLEVARHEHEGFLEYFLVTQEYDPWRVRLNDKTLFFWQHLVILGAAGSVDT